MKLSAAILGVAAAQYESWNYQNDYNLGDASGKVGHAISGVVGGHMGNKRFCATTVDTTHFFRWDFSANGYHSQRNTVECVGEELYCTIEERAHFGQVIGIRAGCAQMMNHPQVASVLPFTVVEEKRHDNQEAARGTVFSNAGTAVNIYYGIGGCLALPAQNGDERSNHHTDFAVNLKNNYFSKESSNGYGNNQCLRFLSGTETGDLLPFGVSVCRVCCLASDQADTVCNAPTATEFLTFDATLFVCTGNQCYKELYPNYSMVTQANQYNTIKNVFVTKCDGATCAPTYAQGGSAAIPMVAGGR